MSPASPISSLVFNPRQATLCCLLGLALLLGGCAGTPQTRNLNLFPPAPLTEPLVLSGVPFFPQQRYQCGPAALATVLTYSGAEVTPAQLVPLVYVPDRRGSFQVEMTATARHYNRLSYRLEPNLTTLLTEIHAGHPVLVLQNLGLTWYPQWHFAVAKGYDLEHSEIILNSADRENYRVDMKVFERTWARANYWALAVLSTDHVPATAEPINYFRAVVALARQGTAQTIEDAYLSGLKKWPQEKNLLMGYGNWLYSRNQLQASKAQFQKAIAAHPKFAPAYNNLAQILLEQGELAEARRYATKAVSLGGEHVNVYRQTLASIPNDDASQ